MFSVAGVITGNSLFYPNDNAVKWHKKPGSGVADMLDSGFCAFDGTTRLDTVNKRPRGKRHKSHWQIKNNLAKRAYAKQLEPRHRPA
jgi:hypothetical protein